MSLRSFCPLRRTLQAGTLLATSLLIAAPQAVVRAGLIADPTGDILPTYTGVQLPGMDVVAHEVRLLGDRLEVFGRMAGPIAPTQDIGALYLLGLDRGQGTARFLGPAAPPIIGPNVLWDSIIRINPDGTGLFNNQLTGVVTPLNTADISVNGNEFSANVPLSLLMPAATRPPQEWTYNLWPRNGIGQNVQVSDLRTDDGNSPVQAVPEPASLILGAIGTLGLLGVGWRCARIVINTIAPQPKMRVIITVLTAASVFSPALQAATRNYSRIVLDDPTGLIDLRDINNHGQGTGGGAIFWQNDELTRLGALGTIYDWSNGVAISDTGYVVGDSRFYRDGMGLEHAFLVTPEDTNGDGVRDRWFRDSDGNGINDLMIDLGARLPGGKSIAADVNSFGQVVGTSDTQGFVWSNGAMTDLGAGTYAARAINDKGQVVGGHQAGTFLINPEDTNADGVPDRRYRDADNNGSNDLMTIIEGGRGVDVNEHGQVLLQLQDYAVLWTPNTPNGTSGSEIFLDPYPLIPIALNETGQAAVWTYSDFSSQALLWENGAFVDIILDPPLPDGAQLAEFYAVNNSGWIIANGGNLLIPASIPEPISVVLLGLGIGGPGMVLHRPRRTRQVYGPGRTPRSSGR